tara:strand:+ start:490 stop:1074 length:585 start_codon:yes stop_codon:yes gene_type:complete
MKIWFVKWGNKYSSKMVNDLSKELKKYRDYSHFCLTENSEGLNIPSIKLPKKYKKVWGKLYLFKVATNGKNIFFDIDNIIHDDPFKILDNLSFKKLTIIHQPWKDKLFYRQHAYDTNICSQIMGWENDLSYIYDDFKTNWQYFQSKYSKGIDRYLTHENVDYEFFPNELSKSKKYEPNKNSPIITLEELPKTLC